MQPVRLAEEATAGRNNVSSSMVANRLRMIGISMRSASESNKGRRYPLRKHKIKKKDLSHKYLDLRMCPRQIAEDYGCSGQLITLRLKEYNIPLRTLSEATKGKTWSAQTRQKMLGRKSPSTKIQVPKDDLEYKYLELGMSTPEVCKDYGCTARTVRNRLREYDIPLRSGKDAHSTERYVKKLSAINSKYEREIPEHPLVGTLISGRAFRGKKGNPYIWCRCPVCKKERWLCLGNLKNSKNDGMCNACAVQLKERREKQRLVNLKRYQDPKERKKTGITSVKSWAENPERREKHVAFMRRARQDPEYNAKIAIAIQAYWDDPIYGEQRRKAAGKRLRKVIKKLWEDPEYKAKQLSDVRRRGMMEGMHIKPNKPETLMIDLLQSLYRNEWKYVGDGQVIIGGRNPDFINVNGTKAIIEIFGTYWHGKQRTGRGKWSEVSLKKRIYAEYGYKTLVIWENELKDIEQVKAKVVKFCNESYKPTIRRQRLQV